MDYTRVFPICSLWSGMALVYRSVMVYNEHINKLAQVKGESVWMMEKLFMIVCEVIIFVVIVTGGWVIMDYNKYSLEGVVFGAGIPMFLILCYWSVRIKE